MTVVQKNSESVVLKLRAYGAVGAKFPTFRPKSCRPCRQGKATSGADNSVPLVAGSFRLREDQVIGYDFLRAFFDVVHGPHPRHLILSLKLLSDTFCLGHLCGEPLCNQGTVPMSLSQPARLQEADE